MAIKLVGEASQVYVVQVRDRAPDGTEIHHRKRLQPTWKDGTATAIKNNRRDAEREEQRVRDAIRTGSYESIYGKKAKALTVADYWPGYFKSKDQDGTNSVSEAGNKRKAAEYFLPIIGHMPINDVGLIEYEKVRDHLKTVIVRDNKPMSGTTISRHIWVLIGMLHHAADRGLRTAHVPRPPKIDRSEADTVAWTPDEANRIVDAFDTPFWRTFMIVAIGSGLRNGEQIALHWTDVDFTNRRITVRWSGRYKRDGSLGPPKGKKTKSVPMSAEVYEALRAHPRFLGSPFVFSRQETIPAEPPRGKRPAQPERPAGSMMSRKETRRVLLNAKKAAGLDMRRGWHQARHTCGTDVGRGGSVSLVMETLRQSSVAVAQRYVHTTAPEVQSALDRAAAERAAARAAMQGSTGT